VKALAVAAPTSTRQARPALIRAGLLQARAAGSHAEVGNVYRAYRIAALTCPAVHWDRATYDLVEAGRVSPSTFSQADRSALAIDTALVDNDDRT
jgi:hypothetical protein